MKWYKPAEQTPPEPDYYYNGDPFIGVFKGSYSLYINKVYAVFDGEEILYIVDNENPTYWHENQLIAWTHLSELREDFNNAMPEYKFY